MFNEKDKDFNFTTFDHVGNGCSHYLLSHNDIKILDEDLNFICRVPLSIQKTYEKLAMSSEFYLLMKNEFTLIGGDEMREIHAPVMNVLLLDLNGVFISEFQIENAYGLAISIQDKHLSFIYSVFCDDPAGRGETEIRFKNTDMFFNTNFEYVIHRNQNVLEFPVCEAVFDRLGRGVLLNSDGEFFVWNLDGRLLTLNLILNDNIRLTNEFHQIRNIHFYNDIELIISYSTGRILRLLYLSELHSLEVKTEIHTGCVNSFQFLIEGPIDERVICSRRDSTAIYRMPNALRFIMKD